MKVPFAITGALSMLLLGCGDELPVSSNNPVHPTLSTVRHALPTLDDDFEAIARLAPGFAGLYVEAGELVILSTGASTPEELTAAIAQIQPGRFSSDVDGTPLGYRIVPATYSFDALREFKRTLEERAWSRDILAVDIDEFQNKLSIATTDQQASQLLHDRLTTAGVPASALSITTGIRGAPEAQVSDKFRPVPAGVRVADSTKFLVLHQRSECVNL